MTNKSLQTSNDLLKATCGSGDRAEADAQVFKHHTGFSFVTQCFPQELMFYSTGLGVPGRPGAQTWFPRVWESVFPAPALSLGVSHYCTLLLGGSLPGEGGSWPWALCPWRGRVSLGNAV